MTGSGSHDEIKSKAKVIKRHYMIRWIIVFGMLITTLLFYGFFFRYELKMSNDPTLVYKFNRLTGRLEFCRVVETRGGVDAETSTYHMFDSLQCGFLIETKLKK